jgi:dTDP-4-dehydrorhamnose reductase
MTVLVLGCRGQLASAIGNAVPAHWEALFADRAMADLSIAGRVERVIERLRPHVVINAAAWTDVDGAESSECLATRINGEAVAEAAAACRRIDAQLIHVSTDYVFDGSGDQPWTEESQPQPLNAYGRSKLRGEQACLQSGHAIIVRTSWLHSSFGPNFVRSILRAAAERPSIRVVNDQVGTPTEAAWLAETIITLAGRLGKGEQLPPIVHAAPCGYASWHEVACHALRTAFSLRQPLLCTADHITPISSTDYPSKAMRPKNSRLDCSRLDALLKLTRPSWTVGVEATVRALSGGTR